MDLHDRPPAAAGAPATAVPDEAELLARLRAGDDAAYETLVRAYGGRLLAVARRLLRDEEEARDAVQEALLSAFKAIERFEGESRISTWLHRITVNAALMRMRSRRRKPETSIEELLPSYIEDGHHANPPARWRELSDEQVHGAQIRELVRASIDRLPENHRTVLLLRDIEELDTKQTAEALGVTENTVKTRLHRARQALREVLDPHLRETAP